MSRRLKEAPGWQQLGAPSLLVGVAVMASYIAFGLHSTAAVHGLLERTVATIGSGWTAVLAVQLIRTARRPENDCSNRPHDSLPHAN
jgi:threonine/homoserine/homoserine lactone efflux protein